MTRWLAYTLNCNGWKHKYLTSQLHENREEVMRKDDHQARQSLRWDWIVSTKGLCMPDA